MRDAENTRAYNVSLHEEVHRKQERIRQLEAALAAAKGEDCASSESSNNDE